MNLTCTDSTPSPKSLGHKPKLIPGNDLKSLATYMKSERCRNVFLMVGAGISTAAGIPDFRSPNTGLYANLARLNLPYPEAVFQIDFFRSNPVPFYTLAKELYPGRYSPTLTHTFISLLNTHSLLHTCFTQNIDALERLAGVPEDKIIEAHGSFATQSCIDCKVPFDGGKMMKAIEKGEIPRCERRRCGGLVKPDIVFFEESLPNKFYASIRSLRHANLLIVIGTSLTVHPFASLVDFVPGTCPRVFINLVDIGEFNRKDDVVLLGRCDDVVRELCKELGWEEELEKMWRGIGRGGRRDTGKANKEDPFDKITKDMEGELAPVKANHGQSKAQEDKHQMGSSDLAEENSGGMQKGTDDTDDKRKPFDGRQALLDFHMEKIYVIARGDMELVEEVEMLECAVEMTKDRHRFRHAFEVMDYHLNRVQVMRKGDRELDLHLGFLKDIMDIFW